MKNKLVSMLTVLFLLSACVPNSNNIDLTQTSGSTKPINQSSQTLESTLTTQPTMTQPKQDSGLISSDLAPFLLTEEDLISIGITNWEESKDYPLGNISLEIFNVRHRGSPEVVERVRWINGALSMFTQGGKWVGFVIEANAFSNLDDAKYLADQTFALKGKDTKRIYFDEPIFEDNNIICFTYDGFLSALFTYKNVSFAIDMSTTNNEEFIEVVKFQLSKISNAPVVTTIVDPTRSVFTSPISKPTSTPSKSPIPLKDLVVSETVLNEVVSIDFFKPLSFPDETLPNLPGIIEFYSGVFPANTEDGKLTLSIMLWRFDNAESCLSFHHKNKADNKEFIIVDNTEDGVPYILDTGKTTEIYNCYDNIRVAMLWYTDGDMKYKSNMPGGTSIYDRFDVKLLNLYFVRQTLHLLLNR